jgi:UrcA family protein
VIQFAGGRKRVHHAHVIATATTRTKMQGKDRRDVMKRQKKLWLQTACALTLGALLGVPAQADRTSEDMTVSGTAKRPMKQVQTDRRDVVTRSIVVAYGDLDLSVPSGAQTLYVRLRGAARAVCSPRETREPERRRDWALCVDTALDEAVAATGIGPVVAMHREATGRDVFATSQLAGAP